MTAILGRCGLIAAAVIAAAGPTRAQQFVGLPDRIAAGDPLVLRIEGVPSATPVEVVVERRGPNGRSRSAARFRSDGAGVVDVSRQAPEHGDYDDVDVAGLFWSQAETPRPGEDTASDRWLVSAAWPGGGITDVIAVSDPAAEVVAIQAPFPGARLFLPAAAPGERYPVLIVLGASEGGRQVSDRVAVRLARAGFAALSLPYHSPDYGRGQEVAGLPETFADIEVDRLQRVRDWLRDQGRVDGERLGVWGVSKGGEMALLAASRFSWIKATAAIVPSDVVWEGFGNGVTVDDNRSSFAVSGQPLPFVPYDGMREAIAGITLGRRPNFRAVHDHGRRRDPDRVEAARIPVERIFGEVLVAGGFEDEIWDSAGMALNVGERRRSAGLATEVHVYPAVGHSLSGDGWSPSYAGRGDRQRTAGAQRELWQATIAFFQRSLGHDLRNEQNKVSGMTR